jgi:uncharacterized protein
MPKKLSIPCGGYEILADLYEAGTEKVCLLLHGYASRREHEAQLAQAIIDGSNATVLVIEYSGHGDSPFRLEDTTPAQHLLEVVHGFDYLRAVYPASEITVMGGSYGGFFAAQLTQYRSFEKLILIAPAIYEPQTFYDTWSERIQNPDNYLKTALQYRGDAERLAQHPLFSQLQKYQGKSLVMVHDSDEMIPVQTTDAYIRSLTPTVFIAKGWTHVANPDFDRTEYYRTLMNHINS